MPSRARNGMRYTFIQRSRPIAATALAVFGILILNENLYHVVTQCGHLGTIPDGAPGVLFGIIIFAWRVGEAYAADHHRFLHSLILQLWVSCWPLLLVIAGTVLSRETFTGRAQEKSANVSISRPPIRR